MNIRLLRWRDTIRAIYIITRLRSRIRPESSRIQRYRVNSKPHRGAAAKSYIVRERVNAVAGLFAG
jgi:hypothetical protein